MSSQTTEKPVRGRKVSPSAEPAQATAANPGSTPGASIKPPETDREWVLELIRVMEWLIAHDRRHHSPHDPSAKAGWQAQLAENYLINAHLYLKGVKPVKPRGTK